MFQTEGVDAVASITDLRMDTSNLLEEVEKHPKGIAVQRNGEPEIVLISWDVYRKISTSIDLDSL
jgi:prevent-host-death family protein